MMSSVKHFLPSPFLTTLLTLHLSWGPLSSQGLGRRVRLQWAVREASLGGVLAQVRESLSNPCSRSGRKEVLQRMMSSLMQFPTGPPPP